MVALTNRDGRVPPYKQVDVIFLHHARSGNLLKLLIGHVGIDIEVVMVVDCMRKKRNGE